MNDALDDMSEKEAVHCLTKLKAQMRIILITKKIQQGSKAVLPAVKL
jgi:ABC-type phosphate transport system ATPase subunit